MPESQPSFTERVKQIQSKRFFTTNKMKDLLSQVVPDQREFVIRDIIDKGHEIEGINTTISGVSAILNAPESTQELGKNILHAFVGPDEKGDMSFRLDNTIKALVNLGVGGASKLVEATGQDPKKIGITSLFKAMGGDLDAASKVAEEMGEFLVERLGTPERIGKTFEQDPVGFFADLASLGLGAGVGLKGTKIGTQLVKGSRTLDPLNIVGKGIKASSKAGQALINESSGATKLINRLVESRQLKALTEQAGKIQKEGKKVGVLDVGDATARLGISGSIPEMVKKARGISVNSRLLLNENLRKITTKISDPDVTNLLGATLEQAKKVKRFTSKKTLQEIEELSKFRGAASFSLSDANKIRQMADDVLDIFKNTKGVKGGRKGKNLKNLRDTTKTLIEETAKKEGFPHVEKLNQTIALTKVTANTLDDYYRSLPIRRRSFIERMATGVSLGVGGLAAITGNYQYLAFVAGVGGIAKAMTLPRFRSFVAAKLATMTKGDFDQIANLLEKRVPTPRNTGVVRRLFREARKVFPELRLIQATTEKQEQQ